MTSRWTRSVPCILILLVLPACHPRPQPAAVEPGAPAWSALYRCRLFVEGESRAFRVAVVAEVPDRFRLELFGPVGGPRLVLASDGTTLAAAVPGERLHATAPAEAASIHTLLGIPLDGADLVALLEGTVRSADSRSLEGGGRVRFEVQRDPGGAVETVDVSAEGPGLDGGSFRVAYSAHASTAAGERPGEVRLSRGDRALVLMLKDARPREVDPAAFQLPAPPGFRAVTLAELARAGVILFSDERMDP